MSVCSNCGNQNAWHTRSWYDKDLQRTESICNACGLEGAGEAIPDVYLPRTGMTFQALCDKTGNPIPIQSKRHKQQVMDELGLREHPDRLKGDKSWVESTRDYRKRNFEQARPQIREAYKQYLQNVRRKEA